MNGIWGTHRIQAVYLFSLTSQYVLALTFLADVSWHGLNSRPMLWASLFLPYGFADTEVCRPMGTIQHSGVRKHGRVHIQCGNLWPMGYRSLEVDLSDESSQKVCGFLPVTTWKPTFVLTLQSSTCTLRPSSLFSKITVLNKSCLLLFRGFQEKIIEKFYKSVLSNN